MSSLKQHEAGHIRQRVTETVSEPKSQEKLTKERNGKLSQKKEKGVGGPTRGWERGRRAFHTVSTDKPATQPMAWSKCDKCSQTPSESASRSSTPSKANVMVTHKLKSPWARFIHTPTHKHFISLKTYFPPFYSHCILLQQDLTPFQN